MIQVDEGCQPEPIEDPDNLDRRRTAVGLQTMAGYLAEITRFHNEGNDP